MYNFEQPVRLDDSVIQVFLHEDLMNAPVCFNVKF